MGVQTITGPRRAEELAEELNRPGRLRPTVVVTMARGAERPYIDAGRLARELDGLADVYLICDPAASWAFSRGMPEMTQVYGGAGRVYPTGLEWVRDLRRSRLRFAYSEAEGTATTERLLDDGLRAADAAGLLRARTAAPGRGPAPEVKGTVSGCPNPSQAMVMLEGGGYATIQVGLLCAGVASDRLFERGMQVHGIYDDRSRRLDVSGMRMPPGERMAEVVDGEVLLGRVESVGESVCEIALLPGFPSFLSRARVTGDLTDDLRDLMSVGEVVPVRVCAGGTALSMVDVDDDVPVRSLAVLPGGPGWLAPMESPAVSGRPEGPDPSGPVVVPLPAPVPNVRVPGLSYLEKGDAGTRDDVEQLHEGSTVRELPRPTPSMLAGRAAQVLERPAKKTALRSALLAVEEERSAKRLALVEKARLEEELRSSTLEMQHLEAELARRIGLLEARDRELERLRRRNRRGAQRDHREMLSSEDLFTDPEDRFRFDVTVCWARRIPAGEKTGRPLSAYRLGSRFLASIEGTPGVDRDKVVDVTVEVLTGLAGTSAGRQMHALRTGLGGNDQPVRRDDGATCFRVSLQRNTPQARRLHFWKWAEEIEFSRVVLHDDYEP
ncbi:hypothetical protein [Kineosporia sp. NBRC 101731]|uniref:hypothetical protein n=1 Tax=Kineosporia sp. NBRC 101731 TaxID=3032199 RepID=UPI0024A4E32E|nr:hypothetical protein [Kineosporia sp. NBRC 101731]GLY28261.1 hypothetical protein Kisp02_16260 [Kineosporia sp. NBRC 101731]